MTIRKFQRATPARPARFAVGEYVYGPFLFFDAGIVVAVHSPNRYGLRMVDIRGDDGQEIGILEVWPAATRGEATARHVERYGYPPRWAEARRGPEIGYAEAAG